MSDVIHILICILAICISSFVNCLFLPSFFFLQAFPLFLRIWCPPPTYKSNIHFLLLKILFCFMSWFFDFIQEIMYFECHLENPMESKGSWPTRTEDGRTSLTHAFRSHISAFLFFMAFFLWTGNISFSGVPHKGSLFSINHFQVNILGLFHSLIEFQFQILEKENLIGWF